MVDCNFTEDTKRLMSDAIKYTEKQRKMFGFNLCLDSDNKIIPGSLIEGGKDKIRMLKSSPTIFKKARRLLYTSTTSRTISIRSRYTKTNYIRKQTSLYWHKRKISK